MQANRVMALDYGDVRIGIALSDPFRVISSPYETYKVKSEEQSLNYFCELIKQKDVKLVVIGLPYNMDGTEGIRAEKTRNFGLKLEEKSGIKVVYEDERLSSVEAEEMLLTSGMRRDKRKEIIDKLAASIILESFLKNKGEY